MKNFTQTFLFALLFSCSLANAQTARVQVIHNSADLAAATVDVYVNETLLLDDFDFRTASPFVDAPAGTEITLSVAPSNSTSAAQSIFSTDVTLAEGGKYIVIANGIVSTSGYTPNQPFNLFVYPMAREEATQANNTDVLVFHGATDAPTVDVQAEGVGTIVDDLAYSTFDGYLELPTADYTISVATADGETVVASYSAPLETLNLEGEALTVLASGFLNPANNSDGPAFGLWVALAAGGDLVQLPLAPQTARVQVIHNAADLAAAVVDVYLNETLLLDDFAFRTASPFVDAPAGTEITLGIAPSNSTSSAQSIFTTNVTLADGGKYIVVANGIVSDAGYAPNQPFNLFVYPMAREEATQAANTDVLVFHGATDAPTVDVQAAGAGTIVDDLEYSTFDGYLELLTADYTLSVATADGETVVASYSAPLDALNLDGQALTVLASGFLNPANNSNGPAFGLWVALAAGGDLVQLPSAVLSSGQFEASQFSIYPNPASDLVSVAGTDLASDMQHTLYDASGRKVMSAEGNSINVSGLSNGIYMLQIANEGQTIQKKLVIKK